MINQKLLLIILISVTIPCSNLYALEQPEEVTNLNSASGHAEDTPFNGAQITMSWSLPANYTEVSGYYYLYTEVNSFIFDEFNSTSTYETEDTVAISQEYNNSDDESYYFYVAAYVLDENDDEIIGSTSSYGPIRIDNVAPRDVSVSTSSDTTSTPDITLTLGATNANEMYISNSGYGSGGSWEPFNTTKSWTLSEGSGLKTIFVQFKDLAENISTASTSITKTEGNIESFSISLTSDRNCMLTWTASEGMTFNLYSKSRADASEYTLQIGGDITNTIGNGVYAYTDTDSINVDQRYYKVLIKGTETSLEGVGKFTLYLSEGCNLVSFPLIREKTNVNDVIGNQLVEGAVPVLADKIHFFTGIGYESTYLKTGGVWSEWPSQTKTTKIIESIKAYWVEIMSGHGTKSIIVTGNIPSENQNFSLNNGFNLIGNPYPIDVPLVSSSINYRASGGQAGAVPVLADKFHFFTGIGYESVYLKGDALNATWSEWPSQSATSRSIETEKGIWVETSTTIQWTWTFLIPY